jgi:tetratricopeptide (TPR) repeat protein
MPVVAPEYIQGMGGISDPGKSYDLMVNQFAYGNLNDPLVSIDRESYRNAMIPKNNFMRLAQAFINNGDKQKAVAALDKCLELFPNERIAYDMYMLPFIDLYYQAGNNNMALDVSHKLKANYKEELEYIDSLRPDQSRLFSNERQQCIGVLQRIQQMAVQYNQKELQGEIDGILAAHGAQQAGS